MIPIYLLWSKLTWQQLHWRGHNKTNTQHVNLHIKVCCVSQRNLKSSEKIPGDRSLHGERWTDASLQPGPGVFWYLSYTLETALGDTAVSHMDAPSWRRWNTCATWMRCRYHLRLKQNKRKVSQRWSVNSHCLLRGCLVAFLVHLLPLLHQTRWNGSTKVYSSQLNILTLSWHECSLYTLCLLFSEISNVFISILITDLQW